jgi:hypothetical protein
MLFRLSEGAWSLVGSDDCDLRLRLSLPSLLRLHFGLQYSLHAKRALALCGLPALLGFSLVYLYRLRPTPSEKSVSGRSMPACFSAFGASYERKLKRYNPFAGQIDLTSGNLFEKMMLFTIPILLFRFSSFFIRRWTKSWSPISAGAPRVSMRSGATLLH